MNPETKTSAADPPRAVPSRHVAAIVVLSLIVPALIGFVPLALFMLSFPPPYTPWWEHSEWMTELLTIAGSALAAGVVARTMRIRFLVAGASFCVAQTPLIALASLGSDKDLLGEPQLPLYLVSAFVLDVMIAAIPLAVGYLLGAKIPPSGAYAPSQLSGTVCGRCGQPLDPSWKYRCGRCTADYEDWPPTVPG